MSIRHKVLSAAVVAVFLAGPANAGPIIEFSTGSAGAGGVIGRFSDNGEQLWGMYIPIGAITISGAAQNNGTYAVTGYPWRPGGAGYLAFDTRYPGSFAISGCIPDIRNAGWLYPNGECGIEHTLMSGKISGWDRDRTVEGLLDAFGDAFMHVELVRALGLENDQYGLLLQWIFSGEALATRELMLGTFESASYSSFRAIPAVPEPATMLLLGSGLLAAFRAGRRRKTL